MGVFNANEVDNYGGNGGGGFFSLQNDKDVARVRFLYNGPEDLVGYAVHQVELDGKKRYVNCLRSYKDPLDVCPLCASKKFFQAAKLFIPIYNIDEDKVQIWERGKKFFSTMSSTMSRYPNFVSHIFEVERNGKPKDTSTTYMLYEVDQDDATLEDFDVPEILGGVVLDKSADDMEYFLQEGAFPPEEDDEEEEMPRRGARNREETSSREREREERPRRGSDSSQDSRRTPQNRGGAASGRRREF